MLAKVVSVHIILLAILSTSISSYAQNLCIKQEKVIFSFHTKSKKILPLCKGNNYLVYKFGIKNKLELQFPNKLNQRSWEQFEFSGKSRPGGKENAGFGEYDILFVNASCEYSIYQIWDDEEDTYEIGAKVKSRNKKITIRGIPKTQEGSLLLLEDESKNIANSAQLEP